MKKEPHCCYQEKSHLLSFLALLSSLWLYSQVGYLHVTAEMVKW